MQNLKVKNLFIILFLFFILFKFVSAEATPSFINLPPAPITPELAILQARVDTLQDLNESILNSVYWTLGILATIFLGLISVNLYFNITGNKREIERIKKDFIERARNEILASEAKILEKISALNQKEFDNIKSDILATTKNEILASEAKILEKISALNQKEFDNIKSDILATTKNEILASEAKILEKNNNDDKARIADIEKIKREMTSIKDTSDDLDTRIKEFEIDRFAKNGQQGQILGMIDLLEKAIDKDNAYLIPSRLLKIRDYVNAHELRDYVATDLYKHLSKIENKDEYKILIEEIRSKIKTFTD